MKTKVLFIHLYNDYSGSPKVLADVIRAVEKEFECRVLTSKPSSGFLDGVGLETKRFTYIMSERRYYKLIRYLFSQLSIFYLVIKNRKSFDLVYVNTLLPFGASLAAFVLRKKVIYHVHETYISPKILYKFLKVICHLTATKILCVSEFLKTEYLGFDDVEVIYNGVSPPGVKKNNASKISEPFVVTMICSLKNYKGLLEFFRVSTFFTDSFSIKFVLQLNATQTEIDSYISINNIILSRNIEVRSSEPNLTSLYLETDLLLNLTRVDECIETFGMTLVEAMSYGIPVIAPPIGGPAEIVQHGKQGFLVDSRDIHRLVESINLLKSDKDLYAKMSNSALRRSEFFSDSEFSKKIKNMFISL